MVGGALGAAVDGGPVDLDAGVVCVVSTCCMEVDLLVAGMA